MDKYGFKVVRDHIYILHTKRVYLKNKGLTFLTPSFIIIVIMKLILTIAFALFSLNLNAASRVNILPSNGAPCVPIINNSFARVAPTAYINNRVPQQRMSYGYSYSTPRVTSVRVPRTSRQPMRTFTNKDGSSVTARLVSISTKSKTAKIKTEKGKLYNVPIQRFSNHDIAYMKNWWENKNKR